MALSTGSPVGNIITQDELYLEGAPNVFFQQYAASELNNPDADGFYWNLSGTATYQVTALGCIDSLQLADNLTMNDVSCDTVGMKNTIMRRNYLELQVNITTVLPLSSMRHVLRAGPVTQTGVTEKMGIGPIDQNAFFHAWMPKVYDEDTGAFVGFQLHKAKFADAWTWAFRYGNSWQIQNLKLRAYADDTKPTAQQFATVIRNDPVNLP